MSKSKITQSDFGLALKGIKDGILMKRECYKNDTVIILYKTRLYQMSMNIGIRYPYVPTNADLLANDWVEVKPNK